MPCKTQFGKCFHTRFGCRSAYIPCGSSGLSQCSFCAKAASKVTTSRTVHLSVAERQSFADGGSVQTRAEVCRQAIETYGLTSDDEVQAVMSLGLQMSESPESVIDGQFVSQVKELTKPQQRMLDDAFDWDTILPEELWQTQTHSSTKKDTAEAKPLPEEYMDRTTLGDRTTSQFQANRDALMARPFPTDIKSLCDALKGLKIPNVSSFSAFENAIKSSKNICLDHVIDGKQRFQDLCIPVVQELIDGIVQDNKVQTGLISETVMSACIASAMGLTEHYCRYTADSELPDEVRKQLDSKTLDNAKFIYWDSEYNNIMVQRGDPGEIDMLLISNGQKIRGEIKQNVARYGEVDLGINATGTEFMKFRTKKSNEELGINLSTINDILVDAITDDEGNLHSLRQRKENQFENQDDINIKLSVNQARKLAHEYFKSHGIDVLFTYNKRGEIICITDSDIDHLPASTFAGSEIRVIGHNTHKLPKEETALLRQRLPESAIDGDIITLGNSELIDIIPRGAEKDVKSFHFEDIDGNRDYVIQKKHMKDNGDGTWSFPIDAVLATAPSLSAHLTATNLTPEHNEMTTTRKNK